MTKNQKKKIEAFVTALPANEREIYRDIAEYAVELGYTPSNEKNTHGIFIALVFSKTKISKRLIKIHPPCIYSDETEFKMQFYGTTEYSEFFHEKLRQDIDAGIAICERQCEKCSGKYVCVYPDGRNGFRCAIHSLVKLSPLGVNNMDEIKKLMKTQDEFWIEQSRTKLQVNL